jgi:ribonuclease HI
MAKQKYYVVWKGRQTGVFNNWDACNAQIKGFEGAIYKSFETLPMAQRAFNGLSHEYIGKEINKPALTQAQLKLLGKPILPSVCVDGACSGASGIAEYQGVDTETKKVIFKSKPYNDGTNNIVEFLAIVHALSHCKKNNILLPIYSDSKIAINWVKLKQQKTNHKRSQKNKELFDLMERAEKWLQENTYTNKLLKWETKAWGENPADFGRK